jgi:2-iminobutanoate/2-iminopropanoate deaminase
MRSRTLVATLALVLGIGFSASASAQTTRQYIDGRSASQQGGSPFSGAVKVGDTLYISGMLGRGDDTATAARAALDGVKDALTKAGMTMDDLVMVQIYASDVAMFNDFNPIYRSYFTKEFPARMFVGAGALLGGGKFEITGIAVKR